MEERGMLRVIKAKVPLSEMFGYTTALRSMTEGRGSANMEFSHYDIVPPHVEKEIVQRNTRRIETCLVADQKTSCDLHCRSNSALFGNSFVSWFVRLYLLSRR